jgi:hypothetical protein
MNVDLHAGVELFAGLARVGGSGAVMIWFG